MPKKQTALPGTNICPDDERPSFSSLRSKARQEFLVGKNFFKSRQSCLLANNLDKLKALKRECRGAHLEKRYDALMTILEEMLIPTDYKVKNFDDMSDVNKVIGFMKFEEAFDIYTDVAEITIEGIRQDTLHTKFKEDLPHENHGLKCS